MVDHAPISPKGGSSGDRGPRLALRASDAVRPGSQKSTAAYERLPGVNLRARPPRVSGAAPRLLLCAGTLGFLFLAAPARASDGGVRFDAPLYGSCPEAPPPEPVEVRGSFFGPVEALDGGQSWLLSPERAARNACLMATCESHRAQLEAGPVQTPLGYVLALGIGLAAGALAGGYFVWSLTR